MRVFLHPTGPHTKPEILSLALEYSSATKNHLLCDWHSLDLYKSLV